MRQGPCVAATTDDHRRRDLAVLIPARNEETLVGRCVRSVLDAGVRPEDIYVIDDESTHGTPGVLGGFAGINVLRHDARRGKAASLLHAIDQYALCTRYAFVSLLDA